MIFKFGYKTLSQDKTNVKDQDRGGGGKVLEVAMFCQ